MDNSQQQEVDSPQFDKGFAEIYSQRAVRQQNYTKEQMAELVAHLTAPIVQEYLREVSHNAIWDVLRLRFEKPEDQLKLAARHSRAMGAIELMDMLIKLGEKK